VAANHNHNGNRYTRRPRGFRLYVRHHCATCHARVFPFDKYEQSTVAPGFGRKGEPILLFSANQHDPEERVAWCWSCNQWVRAIRMTEKDFLLLYLARRGVVSRGPKLPRWQQTAKRAISKVKPK
jgi:hypothetical protein